MSETQKVLNPEDCEANNEHSRSSRPKIGITLNLELGNKNAFSSDQTPTPTRFIRNCEEVGLFQDLQNVNPFDETFKKAAELVKSGSLHIPVASTDDTLHTPHILPHTIEEHSDKFVISRVSSLDEELLKLNHRDNEVIVNESTNLKTNSSSLNGDSLNLQRQVSGDSFSISRVPSIDEDLLIIENRESDSEDDLIVIDECLNLNNESEKSDSPVFSEKNDTARTTTQTPQNTNHNISNFNSNNNNNDNNHIKVKIKEALENRVRNDLTGISTNQGIIIAPIEIDKLTNAESATLLINRKPDINIIQPPRKRMLKISPHPLKKARQLGENEVVSAERQRIREVNRVAALRSRARKRNWINDLQKRNDSLTVSNKVLVEENQRLRNEIVAMKAVLLYHKDCSISKDPEIMKKITHLINEAHQKKSEVNTEKQAATKTAPVPIAPYPAKVISVQRLKNQTAIDIPVIPSNVTNCVPVCVLPSGCDKTLVPFPLGQTELPNVISKQLVNIQNVLLK